MVVTPVDVGVVAEAVDGAEVAQEFEAAATATAAAAAAALC